MLRSLGLLALTVALIALVPPASAQTCPGGCNDQNPCTNDVCDSVRGCLHVANTASCSDGNTCTTNDACQAGVCIGGARASSCTPCQAAVTLPAAGGTFAGVTSGSGLITGSGWCVQTASSPEQVYRWTPTVSRSVEVFTCGSATRFDTVLYVRRGSCTGSQHACNDDGPCGIATSSRDGSRIVMDVIAGQTYFLFVDGYNGARGAYSVTIRPVSSQLCGDGVRQGSEQCDGVDATGCTTGLCNANCTCVPTRCGDGVRQGTEQCDGADATSCTTGLCNANCTCVPTRCGDGVRQGTEQCDGADATSCTTGLCNASCTCVPTRCGDGVRQGSEQCDGSDAAGCASRVCTASCTCAPARCGDGVRQGSEQCDGSDAASCPTGQCDANCACVTVRCGDGVRQGSEQCDLADAGGCASGECYPNCTCIPPTTGHPDLVPEILTPYFEFRTSVPSGDVAEGCASATTGVDLFRFGVRVLNVGRSDLFLGDPLCPEPCSAHPNEVCGNPLFICAPAGGHGHGHYQNYASYDLLSSDGTIRVAGHKQGFCLHDGFDSGIPCPNRHFDTCEYQGLSVGCGDLYEASLGCQYVDVTGLAPGSYTLRVTVDPLGQILEDNEGNNVVTLPVQIPDANCGAASIAPEGGVVQGVTSGSNSFGATCGTGATGPEKVFRWVPPRSGTATIETCGSGNDYDTVLHVRSGSCLGTSIACNDDAPCAIETSIEQGSRVSFPVQAGTPYFIFVDGYDGDAGRFSMRVIAP